MAYGYGYEYISDMLFIHKLVCPEHVCRKQWIVGQSSPLKEWVRKCHKSSNWTLMTDHRQWKDMLSSFILWLCPPLVSSLSSLGNILSALLGISLTMRDYDSTNERAIWQEVQRKNRLSGSTGWNKMANFKQNNYSCWSLLTDYILVFKSGINKVKSALDISNPRWCARSYRI